MKAEKSTRNSRNHTQIVEAKASSAVSINEPLSSGDRLAISPPEDAPTADFATGFEDGGSNDEAEKNLDSEEDAPNYSYVNINPGVFGL